MNPYERAQTVCLLILTVIASGFALYFLRPVLVPFVLALFLTYCLRPPIEMQMRYLKAPRWLALAGTVLLALVVLMLFGLVAGTAVTQMAQGTATYQEQFRQLTEHIGEKLPLRLLGIRSAGDAKRLFSIPEGSLAPFLSAVLRETTAILSNGALVAIFMVFMLLGGQAGQGRPAGILGEVEVRVRRYLTRMVLLSALTGLLIGLALGVLGVQFAWAFGFLAFLLNFVPYIGAILATLLPLPLVLLNPGMSVTAKVLALILPAAIQFIVGAIAQPRLLGSALDLHPGVLLISLIFFGMIWGIVGAFLATPITAVVKLVCERIPAARGVAAVLAGNLDALSGRAGP